MKIKNFMAYFMSIVMMFSAFYIVSANQKNPYSINVNLTQNIVTIYALDDEGEYTVPVKAFYCSVGENNATPTGTYYTSDKYVWRALFGNVYGQYATRITGSILFHSVPYAKQDKSTLKTDSYNKLGEPDSMGCVRLAVSDVKWIYDNCPSKTKVTMYRSNEPEPLVPDEPIKIDTNDPNKGWDPTDPDENNPWKLLIEDEVEEVNNYEGMAGFFPIEDTKIEYQLSELTTEEKLIVLNSKSQEIVIDLFKDVLLLTDDKILARKAELAEIIFN